MQNLASKLLIYLVNLVTVSSNSVYFKTFIREYTNQIICLEYQMY